MFRGCIIHLALKKRVLLSSPWHTLNTTHTFNTDVGPKEVEVSSRIQVEVSSWRWGTRWWLKRSIQTVRQQEAVVFSVSICKYDTVFLSSRTQTNYNWHVCQDQNDWPWGRTTTTMTGPHLAKNCPGPMTPLQTSSFALVDAKMPNMTLANCRSNRENWWCNASTLAAPQPYGEWICYCPCLIARWRTRTDNRMCKNKKWVWLKLMGHADSIRWQVSIE